MKKIIAIVMALVLVFAAGCGAQGGKVAEMDMQAVYDSMIPTMPEMLLMDESMMLNFCGIKAENCKQAVVAVCSDGLRADEIWLIEANDAAALKELQSLAEGRLTRKGEESITYSPEQYAVVEKAQLIRSGNYVLLIVSPDVDALTNAAKQALNIG